MKDKLCVTERRTRILEFLSLQRQSTREEMATRFSVSSDTIDRDIKYLSCIAPIYTKSGNGGGVYILPEYRSYKNYLTDDEEALLYSLLNTIPDSKKIMLNRIIIKFSKNPLK